MKKYYIFNKKTNLPMSGYDFDSNEAAQQHIRNKGWNVNDMVVRPISYDRALINR